MQWEVFETQKCEPKFEFKQAPNSLPTISEAKEGDPKLEVGPMAMTYNPTAGWVAEKMGPTSKHWKRLARGTKTNEPTKSVSPIKQKRETPTPLNDLDPNALDQKRRQGKNKLSEDTENDQMVGSVVVAAGQHRRAQ